MRWVRRRPSIVRRVRPFHPLLGVVAPGVGPARDHPRDLAEGANRRAVGVAVDVPLAETVAVVGRDDDALGVEVVEENAHLREGVPEVVAVRLPHLLAGEVPAPQALPDADALAELVLAHGVARKRVRNRREVRLHVVDDEFVRVLLASGHDCSVGDGAGGNRPQLVVPSVAPHFVQSGEVVGVEVARGVRVRGDVDRIRAVPRPEVLAHPLVRTGSRRIEAPDALHEGNVRCDLAHAVEPATVEDDERVPPMVVYRFAELPVFADSTENPFVEFVRGRIRTTPTVSMKSVATLFDPIVERHRPPPTLRTLSTTFQTPCRHSQSLTLPSAVSGTIRSSYRRGYSRFRRASFSVSMSARGRSGCDIANAGSYRHDP